MNISPYIIPGLKYHYGLPELVDKLRFIENIVATHFGETIEGIKMKSRVRRKVLCRHICFYLMRNHTNLSLKEIGQRYSYSSDHTTVIHGINTIKDLMFSDQNILKAVHLLEEKIEQRN